MMMIFLQLVTVVTLVAGHGVFWTPDNRATISQAAGDQPDATMIIAEPMPDIGTPDRPYPGNRPFAEPGKSISNIGPCGSITYSPFTNWNKPDKSWGNVTTTYKGGDIVDVEWCVDSQADHGGLYSYRICQDDKIVAKYINASYTPTASDWTDMENCLQAGKYCILL